MKAKHCFNYLLWVIVVTGYSQEIPVHEKLLKVGDRAPDVTLVLEDYPGGVINLARFNDKELLILAFWSTTCAPCVAKFPLQDSLQRKFNDRIQILPLTAQDEAYTRSFFNRIKKAKNLILPYAFDAGAVVRNYFASDGVSTGGYVWIKGGVIIGLTSSVGVTEENIRGALAGRPLKGNRMQAKPLVAADFSRPYFFDYLERENREALYTSVFTGYVETYGASMSMQEATEDDPTSGLRYVNFPLISYYQTAYGMRSAAQGIYELRDARRFNPSRVERDTTVYSYELVSRGHTYDQLMEILREDLRRAFGIRVTREMREVNCLVLKKVGAVKASAGGVYQLESSVFHLLFVNVSFKGFATWLRSNLVSRSYPYFFDETGLGDLKIDIALSTDMTDPVKVNEALREYGLELRIEKREMEMFVFRDEGGTISN